jgi:hypothetical protein
MKKVISRVIGISCSVLVYLDWTMNGWKSGMETSCILLGSTILLAMLGRYLKEKFYKRRLL